MALREIKFMGKISGVENPADVTPYESLWLIPGNDRFPEIELRPYKFYEVPATLEPNSLEKRYAVSAALIRTAGNLLSRVGINNRSWIYAKGIEPPYGYPLAAISRRGRPSPEAAASLGAVEGELERTIWQTLFAPPIVMHNGHSVLFTRHNTLPMSLLVIKWISAGLHDPHETYIGLDFKTGNVVAHATWNPFYKGDINETLAGQLGQYRHQISLTQ